MYSEARGAVGRVIEHGSRMAGDSQKVSTHRRSLADLLHPRVPSDGINRALDVGSPNRGLTGFSGPVVGREDVKTLTG